MIVPSCYNALMVGKKVRTDVDILGNIDSLKATLVPLLEFRRGELEMCQRAGLRVMIIGGEEPRQFGS